MRRQSVLNLPDKCGIVFVFSFQGSITGNHAGRSLIVNPQDNETGGKSPKEESLQRNPVEQQQ